MSIRKTLVLAALLVMSASILVALPTVDLIRPPAGRLADIDGWRLHIASDSAYQGVWLVGWIRANNAPVYSCTTHAFDLAKGTRTLRLADVRIRWQQAARGYEVFRFRSGNVPEGEYEYGVTLLPFGEGDSGRTTGASSVHW